jgi:hypothetical protein
MGNLWVGVEELGEHAESLYAYDAVQTASYMLWALSGRKFSGITTVTERYVTTLDPHIRAGVSRLNYQPILLDGRVENVAMGGFGRYSHHDFLGDGTSSYSRVRLRGRKVVKVHSLRDDNGNIIDPSTYYLYDHSTVLGTRGAKWTSQNVEVTYTYGTPPPTAGRAAARMLAIELVRLYENDDRCALPQRVTSVVRQGVVYTILDNQSFIDELKTGIYAVDLFLKTTNPDKARARSRVFSPDVPRARRITGRSPVFQLSAFDLYYSERGGSTLYYLDELGAGFLSDEQEWTVSAVVSNYDGTVNATLPASSVTLDRADGSILVSSDYRTLEGVTGPRDPGTIDLYASRPSLEDPSVEEVVNLVTANLICELGRNPLPIGTF